MTDFLGSRNPSSLAQGLYLLHTRLCSLARSSK